VLPERVDLTSVEAVRAVLDGYDVGGRLQHIREFIWRGGALNLQADHGPDTRVLNVRYELRAEWAAAVLERPTRTTRGLAAWDSPVVEGRWVRGRKRYELRVGIDLAVPSAIYIRSLGFVAHVPFHGRLPDLVESALNAELTAYVDAFLNHFQSVPQAVALDAQRLHRLQLTS
jgi:hypothetical protein